MYFTFNFKYSPWFILLCVILAATFAFFLYYRDKKLSHVSTKIVWLLAIFRFISTFIIAFLLLSPVFNKNTKNIDKPIIGILIDNSQSVKLSQKFDKNIKEKIDNFAKNIDKQHKIVFFGFDSKLIDSISYNFEGQQTNISQAIENFTNRYYNQNIGAVVIFTDGIYNAGNNPLITIENVSFPIYTVGIGDTTLDKDLFIKHIDYNRVSFVNNEYPIQITLSAKKLAQKNCNLSIFNKQNNLLHNQNIEITSNNFLYKTTVFFSSKQPGIEQYIIKVTEFEEEKNKQNNTAQIAIEIKENKQNILILANSPHPDVGSLHKALNTNINNNVEIAFIDNFQNLKPNIQLIIFYQLPSQNNNFQNIYQQTLQRKIPHLFVLGTQTNYFQLKNYNTGLIINRFNGDFDFVYPLINKNFEEFKIPDKIETITSTTAPLLTPFADINTTANTKVLFYRKIKDIATQKPLICVTSMQNYKVGTIIGENFWRWRLMNYDIDKNFETFDNFINQFCQYLIASQNISRFIVNTDRIINTFDDVVFVAQAFNEAMELTNENDVKLTLIDSLNKEYDYIMQRSKNAYTLNIGKLPQGNYRYKAQTTIAGRQFTANGVFTVVESNIEALNTTADFDLLRQIALKTDAKFVEYQKLDSLADYINQNPNITARINETSEVSDFLNFKIIFFIILFWLTIEWLIRKILGTY